MPLIIKWSKQVIQALIDEKRWKNSDYYRIFGWLRLQFWREVVEKVKKDTGITFTIIQYRDKFKSVVRNYKVYKVLTKYI